MLYKSIFVKISGREGDGHKSLRITLTEKKNEPHSEKRLLLVSVHFNKHNK